MAIGQRSRTAPGQRSGIMLGQIQRLFARGTVSGLSEGQLLARFVVDRDELAFEAIVSRHGPMVLGVCRRLLDDPHDVEDGFQATFLVLVRKAGSLNDRELLAKWLYGVALRVATRLRRDRTRLRVRERTDVRDEVAAPADDGSRGELPLVLDQEVARLPAQFRTPIVLCYFEGLTHDQAAEQLGCPVGTVRSRMAKGRELLRTRLTRRGFAPASWLPVMSPLVGVAPAIPPALLNRTIAAAASIGAVRPLAVGTASTAVVTLAEGVLRAMLLTRWTTLAAIVVVLGAVGSGVTVAARQHGTNSVNGAIPGSVPADQVRTARQALDELQRSIDKYQKQLIIKDMESLYLKEEIAALKAKIRAMEVNAEPQAPAATASRTMIDQQTAAVSADSATRGAGDQVPSTDYVTRTKRMIVSQSAANNQVVIFAVESGRSRIYRPPAGIVKVFANAEWNQATIAAIGPRASQLTIYDADRDQWAIQDLPGMKGANDYISFGPHNEYLRSCSFRAPHLTQLALFDIGRFQWSVQDLVEPWEEGAVDPFVAEKVAVYVVGRFLYAYSADAGRWDVLKLEQRVQPKSGTWWQQSPLTIENNIAAVSQGGHLHIFPAKTGRWQAVEPKE
jgi:RNA polymerase sigma factor (sigma-70 family)